MTFCPCPDNKQGNSLFILIIYNISKFYGKMKATEIINNPAFLRGKAINSFFFSVLCLNLSQTSINTSQIP